jgi:hypothetical protein
MELCNLTDELFTDLLYSGTEERSSPFSGVFLTITSYQKDALLSFFSYNSFTLCRLPLPGRKKAARPRLIVIILSLITLKCAKQKAKAE